MNKIKSSKEIALLKEQLNKLEASDFELNAWKSFTLILLERIFGNRSQKITQIEKINYDYSSWSLRDTTGSSGNLDSCKKLAGEIIQSSIEELENFGKPEVISEDDINSGHAILISTIKRVFEDELKGSQLKELKLILSSGEDKENMKSRIVGKIKEYGVNTAPEILALILMNEDVSQIL